MKSNFYKPPGYPGFNTSNSRKPPTPGMRTSQTSATGSISGIPGLQPKPQAAQQVIYTKPQFGYQSKYQPPQKQAASDLILGQLNQRTVNTSQQGINAAAMQDHFSKKFNLGGLGMGGLDPFRKPVMMKGVRRSSAQGRRMPSGAARESPIRSQQQRSESQNQQSAQKQGGVQLQMQQQKDKEKNALQDIESKRMNYINKLSLAERLGLVDKPALPKSIDQWKHIEQQFLMRTKNNICEETCAICYENLQFNDQVILSCSHVLHQTCLSSFEKFMNNNGKPKACPICREEKYDSKPFVEGQARYLEVICCKMQGLVRGFIARNAFYQGYINRGVKPQHEEIRKRFIGFKLGLISKKQMSDMAKYRIEADAFIDNTGKNVRTTEKLLQSFYPNVARMLQERHAKKELETTAQRQQKEEQKVDRFWEDIKAQVRKRGDKDCPICFNPLFGFKKNHLLDCTHCFHKSCLESFEKFEKEQQDPDLQQMGHAVKYSCPMCRHKDYKKIEITQLI